MNNNQTTENKVIDAAKQVFIEKGLEGTKMSDIAERAGISRTTLNYYYRTKENLFHAIIEQIFDILLPRVELISLENGDFASKVEMIVDIYDDVLRKNENMPRFVFVEIQRNPSLISEFVARSAKAQLYISTISELLEHAVDSNFTKMTKEHVLTTFVGLIVAPYLLEPLLAMYRTDEKEKEIFKNNQILIIKRLLRACFE